MSEGTPDSQVSKEPIGPRLGRAKLALELATSHVLVPAEEYALRREKVGKALLALDNDAQRVQVLLQALNMEDVYTPAHDESKTAKEILITPENVQRIVSALASLEWEIEIFDAGGQKDKAELHRERYATTLNTARMLAPSVAWDELVQKQR